MKAGLFALAAIGVLVFVLAGCANTTGAEQTYTVRYDGNGNTGGSVPVDDNRYVKGHIVTVLGNTGYLTNVDGISTAYGFTGWNTRKDGSGTHYAARSTFTIASSDKVLYAQWSPFALRDAGPAGGLIFHIKGSYSDGWRYLEAAPASTAWEDAQWGENGDTCPGAAGTGVGTGQQNTIDIITRYGTGSTYAAQLCDGLSHAGCEDWFLPSRDELALMYQNLHMAGVGDFPVMYYWSSSQVDQNNAWQVVFDAGTEEETSKLHGNRVRAARAF